MKIALFSDTWWPNINGVVISLTNQIKILAEKHEVWVFVPRIAGSERFFSPPDNVTMCEMRSMPFPAYPGYKIGLPDDILRKTLKEHQFHVVHSHGPFSMGLFAVLSARIQQAPLIATFHTWISEYVGHLFAGFAEETIKRVMYGFSWSFTNWYFNKSDIVITPSLVLQSEMEKHGLKTPVVTIPNCISRIFFEKNVKDDRIEERSRIRESFGIPTDVPVFTYVGRISFEKRLNLIFLAFKNVIETLRKRGLPERQLPYLVIAGDGPNLSYYRNYIKKMSIPNAIITGYIAHEDLPPFYRACDIFVTASDTETQGLTVIEAMSQGLPVMGVKAGGIKDYIRHDVNGWLVPPRNQSALAKAMLVMLEDEDLRIRLAKNALKTAKQYTPNSFRKNLERLYLSIIKEKQKSFRD